MNFGLVGIGYWGEKLLRVFSALDGVTIRLVADADPLRLALVDPHLRTTGDPREVVNDPGVDVVVIATPPASHATLARDALRAGKHCWIEKPLALSVSDGRELVSLARERRRTLFVDETFLYDPLAHRARQWIREGRLGRLFHLSFERLGLGRVRRDSNIWWNSGPHDLSLLLFLTAAEVERIQVEGFAYLQPPIADVCIATARLAGGASAHFHLSWLSPIRCARAVAVGSEGMLCYEGRFEQRSLTYYDYRLADPAAVPGAIIPIERFSPAETVRDDREPLTLAARAFLDSIRTGTPARSDGTRSLKVIELLAAAESANGSTDR
jgi:predicted dehydrogenase